METTATVLNSTFISRNLFSIDSNFTIDNIRHSLNLDFLNATDIYLFLKYFFIPVILVFLLSIMLVIIYRRYSLDKIDLKKVELEDTVNDFLTEIIFSGYTDEETIDKINDFKKSVVKRNSRLEKFVLKKLLHIKQNVQQMNQDRFIFIYEQFGFNLYTKKLINHRNWHNKSQGFFHYQILDYKLKKDLIKPYLNSRNASLRSNALIAMISLSDENFDVLDDYKIMISRADELKILDIIYQKEVGIPTNIDTWLHSKNDSIVIIAIKLIVRYKYKLSTNQIYDLLQNDNYVVRKEAILAVRELGIEYANEILIEQYKIESSLRNKISILKTFQKIGNLTTKDYALHLLSNENNLDLKFEIVNCIYQIDKNFFSDFKAQNQQEDELINKMLLHHKSPYLN